MVLFDGITEATALETELAQQVRAVTQAGGRIRVEAILFAEDTGSQVYTHLKREAAERVGIEYVVETFSILDEAARVVATIDRANRDWQVTGTIVQKPSKATWKRLTGRSDMEYQLWWQTIMSAVAPEKDVDGLHPQSIAAITTSNQSINELLLPATCQAVLHVLDVAKTELREENLGKTIILGRTDLVGIPLQAVLQKQGVDVILLGSKEFASRQESEQFLLDAHVIVSATGKEHLITAMAVSPGVVLIDVGEPKPDIDPAAHAKARFVSPVPGGVGPLTVQFLLRNALQLWHKQQVSKRGVPSTVSATATRSTSSITP